jgi:ribosomal protein S18 acetylase RimI-like enzyme
MSEPEPVIRKLRPTDSLAQLTDLLHRAYHALAERGLHFFATHQSVEQTRRRIAVGTVFVIERGGKIIACIHYRSPAECSGTPWYDRDEVAYIGQLAVEPSLQGQGIANRLMDHVEQVARADGAAELALDTAETATRLIGWYERRGYRFIEHADWEVTNYRSVVMSKRLL